MNKYIITGTISLAALGCAGKGTITPESSYSQNNIPGKLSSIETDLAKITADGKIQHSKTEFTDYLQLKTRLVSEEIEAKKDPVTQTQYDRIKAIFDTIDTKFVAQQKAFIMYAFNDGANSGMMPELGQTIYLSGTPKDISAALGVKLGDGVYDLPNATGVDAATFQQRLASLPKLDVVADPTVVGKLEALLPDNGPLSKANFKTYTDGITSNGEMLTHFIYVGLQLPQEVEVPEYAAPVVNAIPTPSASPAASLAPSASPAASPSPSASPAPAASPAASPVPSATPAPSPTAGTPGVTGGP